MEIPLLIKKTDADNRDAEVACRLQLVTGDVSETSRVDGKGFAQHELHTEIRHMIERGSGRSPLKPAGLKIGKTARLRKPVQLLPDGWIGKNPLHFFPRNGLKKSPGVVGQLPENRIELPPEGVGRMVPGPAQVQRQTEQSVKALHIRMGKTKRCCILPSGRSVVKKRHGSLL